MMRTDIKRTTFCISTYCNLKCKHCLAFIPYYKEHYNVSYEEAKEILSTYFQVVDSVEHFTVTGGEPLLNVELQNILQEVFQYLNQITVSVDLVTNGTMEIPNSVLDLFEEHKDKSKIVLSNYGDSLSTKIKSIETKLKKRDINYRISEFAVEEGKTLYYGGWIDFTDHSMKWKTEAERDNNALGCLHRVGKYFILNVEGELYTCSRSLWRIKNGIIPKIEGEYISLIDESVSIEEKRKLLLEMYDKKSFTSCAYCVGLRNDVERVYPAQQL